MKKRSKAEYARIYGSEERVEWVKAEPSVATGRSPCVNAHVVKGDGGMSYKASAKYIAPLTHEEHMELHRIGQHSFEQKYGLSLEFAAEQTEQAWQAHCNDRL